MKKIILMLSAALVLFAGCGVTESRTDRLAREAEEAKIVRENIENRSFTVNFNTMMPQRGPSRFLNDSYYVKIDGEEFISCLPFMGQAHNLPYGGGSGFNFTAEVAGYSYQETKPGVFDVNIQINTNEDNFLYAFRIFDNGNTSLDVSSRNRDRVSYTGSMALGAE